MPSSRIIDLALGLALVFGVTASLSSMITELAARFVGLRGAFLLRGLRELLDGGEGEVTHLSQVHESYEELRRIIGAELTSSRSRALIDLSVDATVAAASTARAGAAPAGAAPALVVAPPQVVTAPAPTAAGPSPTGAPATGLSATGAVLGSPILRNQGITGQMSDRQLTLQPGPSTGRPSALRSSGLDPGLRDRRSLPAYIPARSFAEAVIDVLVPDASGTTSMSTIRDSVNALPDSMSTFKTSLQALVKSAGDDSERFRQSLEHWYDNHMARVAGWYKRRVAKITLVVGAILVVVANINAVTIARTLYTDDDVRTAVSAVAAQSTACPAGQDQQSCLTALETELSTAASAGVPLGWGTVTGCTAATSGCNWWDSRGIFDHQGDSGWRVLLLVIGFLITITALVPGSRFWFDLLSKLGSLRSTGPRPPGASP